MNNIEEDEIDLRELFKTIWTKRLFIAIFTLIITLLAIVYAYSKTPIYQVETVLEIGSITDTNINNSESRQLEPSNTLLNRINIIYNINIPKDEITRLSKISIIKGSKNLIKLEVISTSNIEAIKKLEAIIDSIKNEHLIKIDNYLKIMNERLELLKSEEKRFLTEIEDLNKNIITKEKSINDILKSNPAVAAIYTMNLNAKTNELIDLKNKSFELRNDISKTKISMLPENIQVTKTLGALISSDSPIKPKKKLIVVVAFVTGLILSIFLVFFMSFIAGFKQEYSEEGR